MAKRVDPNTPLNPGDISAGRDVARYNQADAGRSRVAEVYSQVGLDPTKNLASQIVSGQERILTESNKLFDELRTLKRAQEEGIALKNQDERMKTVVEKINVLSSMMSQVLSGGLPQLRNERGQFTGQQNTELEASLVRLVHQANNQTATPSPYTTAFSNIRSDVRYTRAVSQGMAVDPDSRGRIEDHGNTLERMKYELRQQRKEAMDRGDMAAAREAEQYEIELANVETERANILSQGIDQRPEYVRDIEKLKLEHRAISGGGVSDAFKQRYEASRARMQGEIPDLKRRRAEALEAGDVETAFAIDEELSKKSQFVSSTEDTTLPYAARMSQIRTQTKVGAAIKASGEQIPAELKTELERHRDELRLEIPELNKKALEATLAEDWESAEKLMKEHSAKSQGLKSLVSVLEEGADKQGNALNQVLKHVGTVVSALGVGQLVSRAVLQEPYRFGTVPALNVLGKQGEIGQMLSGAYGQLEEYSLGLNQQALGMGMGLGGLGASMAMLGKAGSAGRIGGLGMLAAGGIMGIMGLTQNADNAWYSLPGTTDENEIIAQNLVQQVADPSRLTNNFATSRAGLMAAGGLGMENFGYSENSTTGNFIHDRMGRLTSLGYSQEDLGALLSATAGSLIGSQGDMTRYGTAAGTVASAYGLNDQSVLSMMQQSQRYGSSDAEGSLLRGMGAASGKNGEITTFTTGVLVPAIMGAVEGLALSNLARNAEDLESEVFTLRKSIADSDTNLGTLIQSNPALIGQITSTLNQTVKGYTENPAMLAYQLALGNSYSDMVMGKATAVEPGLRHALNLPGLQGVDFNDPTMGYLNNIGSRFAFGQMQSMTGIEDPQLLANLAAIFQKEGTLFGEDGGYNEDARAAIEGAGYNPENLAQSQLDVRVQAIVESKVGSLAASLAEQTDAAIRTSIALQDEMIALQGKIQEFIASPRLISMAEAGIQSVLDKINSLLGIDTPSEATQVRDDEGNIRPGLPGTLDGVRPSNFGIGFGMATGGYTGAGGSHQAAGIVHAGEYVISSNNVTANKDVLERIQSGERVTTGSMSSSGNSTVVTLRVQGMDPREIYEVAERATTDYITRNRLNYT